MLSYSRKGYSEVVLRQTTDAFVMWLENAFWHFGGVPKRVVLDNLKAAVLHADWFDPELHPKMQAFAEHYGCVFLPTKPRMPRHKGKVERGVDYVQENALKGQMFTNVHDQNDHLTRWEAEVADVRVHGTTRRAPGQHFLEVEKAALLPLPSGRLASFRESQRRVHRDGHIEVEKAYYSAPPEYVGQTVWARWDGRSFLAQALGYHAIKAGFVVLYRSVFDLVRDFLHDELLGDGDKMLAKYLKPDLLIIDDMGMKQLPKRSGECLFEIVLRRYETRSTIMTSKRGNADAGKKLVGRRIAKR